ncbi:hypothetical protein OIU78_009489 [Salix suchowensis]|nr:hypothetical protein OIU78_009489 [Salix suchowensis]
MMRRQNQDQQSRVFDELSAFSIQSPPFINTDLVFRANSDTRHVGEEEVAGDNAGRICVVAIRDVVVFDVMRIGDVFYWVFVDALGSWIGYGVLCCRDCLRHLHGGPLSSLLRHGSSLFSSKGVSW